MKNSNQEKWYSKLSDASLLILATLAALIVGAMEYVRERLLEERKSGTAILLISEDLDEIFALADRIAVIFEGQIMGVVQRNDATLEKLGLLMAGVKEGV